jgi:hypothetical protein
VVLSWRKNSPRAFAQDVSLQKYLAPTSLADQTDIGPKPDNGPHIAAAGMFFSQLDAII